MRDAPDPVIVIGLAIMAGVMFVIVTALRDESAIRDTLDFRAAVLQVEDAGK